MCLERAGDVAIRLEGGQDDVQEPQQYQNTPRNVLYYNVSSELCSKGAVASSWNEATAEDDADGDDGADDVDSDREGEGASLHIKLVPLGKRWLQSWF